MVDFPNPFEWLLIRYASLVSEVESGYEMCIDEYTNDLYFRSEIQQKLDDGYAVDAAFLERLEHLDQRLQRMLIPTTRSIEGSKPANYFWFYGIPHNAPELLEDGRAMGVFDNQGA